MVFNATFNTISVISWRSVLLVEETGVPDENHRHVTSHWQTLSHNIVSSTPRLSGIRIRNVSGDMHRLHIRHHITYIYFNTCTFYIHCIYKTAKMHRAVFSLFALKELPMDLIRYNEWVSDCCLTAKWTCYSYIMIRTSYIQWYDVFFSTNTFSWIHLVLAHWNNSLLVVVTLHLDTVCLFRSNSLWFPPLILHA